MGFPPNRRRIDLLFSVAVAIATGLLFGLAPACRPRAWICLPLESGDRRGGGRKRFGDIAQGSGYCARALSFLLLVGAGLFAKTLGNLKDARTGMEKIGNVITFRIEPALAGYTVPRMRNFNTEVLREIRATPGVKIGGLYIQSAPAGGAPDMTMSPWRDIRPKTAKPCRLSTTSCRLDIGRQWAYHCCRAGSSMRAIGQIRATRTRLRMWRWWIGRSRSIISASGAPWAAIWATSARSREPFGL